MNASFGLKLSLVFLSVFLLLGLCMVGVASLFFSACCFGCVLSFFVLFRNSRFFTTPILILNVLVFTLIASDFVLRLMLPGYLYYRPHERFIRQWPLRPYLVRYQPDVRYSGTTYGDLAAFSGKTEIREEREIDFRTDQFGFRNDPRNDSLVFDLIVIGDSFGVGNGTTQDAIWPALLADEYGLNLYNLSMAPGNPWRHFVNLCIEIERLSVRPGGVVLLALFSGNDLDEFYGNPKGVDNLHQNGWLKRTTLAFHSFRRRSPLNRLRQKLKAMARYQNNLVPDRVSEVHIELFTEGQEIAFYTPYMERVKRSQEDIRQHPNFSRLKETLYKFKQFCEQGSLTLKVVLFPSKPEVYAWVLDHTDPRTAPYDQTSFSETVQFLCSQDEIEYLDLFPILAESSRDIFIASGKSLWWYDDTHINERGHAVVTDAIYKNLLHNIEKDRSKPTSVEKTIHDIYEL